MFGQDENQIKKLGQDEQDAQDEMKPGPGH
jgi:hypothetical protein